MNSLSVGSINKEALEMDCDSGSTGDKNKRRREDESFGRIIKLTQNKAINDGKLDNSWMMQGLKKEMNYLKSGIHDMKKVRSE